MKPGLIKGMSETIAVTVTPAMFAGFEGQLVHPAYSTAWMVYHMEWASRKIILPYLENDEEGMGASVAAKHIAPALEGETVTVSAVFSSINNKTIITEVTAHCSGRLIALGEVKQVILPKVKIKSLLKI